MREILFRGKRVGDNDWVYGYYYKAKLRTVDSELCDFITIPHPEEEGRRSDHYMVYSETVGQWTGLTDKNGIKIFEGDIFSHPTNTKYKYPVTWEDETASFGWFNDDGIGFDNSTIEVIGNIYDNPELLK